MNFENVVRSIASHFLMVSRMIYSFLAEAILSGFRGFTGTDDKIRLYKTHATEVVLLLTVQTEKGVTIPLQLRRYTGMSQGLITFPCRCLLRVDAARKIL